LTDFQGKKLKIKIMINVNIDWTAIARYLKGDMSEDERSGFEKQLDQQAEFKKVFQEAQALWGESSLLAKKMQSKRELVNVEEKIEIIKEIIQQQESDWTKLSVFLSAEDIDGEKVTSDNYLEKEDSLKELAKDASKVWETTANLGKKLKNQAGKIDMEARLSKMISRIESEEGKSVVEPKVIEMYDSQINVVNKNLADKQKKGFSLGIYQRLAAAIVLVLGVSLLGYFLTSDNIGSQSLAQFSTTNGEVKKVTLPDGSSVWLNAESVLQYPEKFTAYERKVVLQGEGFFDVQKDSKRPFVIETEASTTKVLGTSFNLKAYKGENVVLSVETGKVMFFANDKPDNAVTLTPDEAAILNLENKNIAVNDTVATELSVWKQGKLIFKNASLVEVAQTLERAYNVKVVLLDKSLEKRKFTGEFEEKPIKYVLDRLAEAMGLKYEMKDNLVEISK
jgi:ferric-dicitrate binding protein FerR (iron transport regulator)